MSNFEWSPLQLAIFGAFENPLQGPFVVQAVAGSGKTTTLVEGVNRAPETSILAVAFNKRIAVELER